VKRTRLLLTAALLFACLPLHAAQQSDEEKARGQLQELQGEIQRINREIASAGARRSKLQRKLRDSELRLGTLQREMSDTLGEIRETQGELSTLESRRSALEESRDRQQARVAAELRSAWQMGRQGQFRVLLNQESPHTVARAMGYYRYFFEARNELLEEYRQTLRELETVEREIADTLEQLEARQTDLEAQQASLLKVQEKRERAVAAINASISSKSERLQQLEEDRKELEHLLQAIEEAVVDLEVPADYQPFEAARGAMPWPVEGKPSNHFGRPRNEGKMRWQGVNIPAREGATVRAIHHGRVVFADWFRGSGLLLIIDHGDGYMSLYAHNQSLLREVGEWVTAGTPIGTVGSSGGLAQSALYFEIRHQGKPTDPEPWCRG